MLAPAVIVAALQAPPAPLPLPRSCETVCYEGTIEYVDEAGVRHIPRTGSAMLWRRAGRRWHVYEADILQGRVYVEMPACNDGVDIGRIVVDGREAYVLDQQWPTLQWTARLPLPVQLNVVDAASSMPMSSIELREDETLVPPLDSNDGFLVAGRSTTPVRLPAWSVDPNPYFLFGAGWKNRLIGKAGSNPRRFWVRAPGYAWTTVVGDFEMGGNLTARLVPRATLRVALSSRSRLQMGERHPLLEVRVGSECRWKQLGSSDTALDFDGLPAGELTLRWRADDGGSGEQELVAETSVTLVAGKPVVVEF